MRQSGVYFLGTLCFAIFGCGQDLLDTSVPKIDLPQVEIECSGTLAPSTCLNQSLQGKPIQVGWAAIGTCPSIELENYSAYGTANLECTSSGCTGKISQWKTTDLSTITQIDAGSYIVCASADANDDGSISSGEIFGLLNSVKLSSKLSDNPVSYKLEEFTPF